MIQRACTHGIAIKTPTDPNDYSQIVIVFSQNQREILKKVKQDLVLTEEGVFLTLTQEETLLFKPSIPSVMGRAKGQPAYLQIRAYKDANEVVGSKSWKIDVYDAQNEEVLGNGS